MTIHQMFLSVGTYQVDSADFDGTNDWMTRGAGLTGAADSKSGILSFWTTIALGNGVAGHFLDGSTTVGGSTLRVSVGRDTANKFFWNIRNAAGTQILVAGSTTAYTTSGTWLNVLSSWDLAQPNQFHLYVNDSSDATITTFTDDTIDYTLADWGICTVPIGATLWDGLVAEVYFAPGQYLDFSVEANRRKFISASGKPVALGTTGSSPTGTAPLIYQHLYNGEAVATFATNRGTGGDFSITGTLATGSTSPSD